MLNSFGICILGSNLKGPMPCLFYTAHIYTHTYNPEFVVEAALHCLHGFAYLCAVVVLDIISGNDLPFSVKKYPFYFRRSHGYEESLQTFGLISGYFNSASALGAFIGPTASGYLYEKYGFPWTTTINGFLMIALVSDGNFSSSNSLSCFTTRRRICHSLMASETHICDATKEFHHSDTYL